MIKFKRRFPYPAYEEATMENPQVSPQIEQNQARKLVDNYTYSPVNVNESVGALLLGILAILLFIALRKTQKQYEALLAQTRQQEQG